MDQYKEMQDRLAKVGSRPFVPPAETNDYSELQNRLGKMGNSPVAHEAETIDHSELQARLNGFASEPKRSSPMTAAPVPEVKSSPIVAPKLPAPEPPKQESIAVLIVKPVPVPKPEPEPEVLPPIPKNTVLDTVEPNQSTSYFPHKPVQSKGRSSWILWVGIVLFAAFVIAQLIWVMS